MLILDSCGVRAYVLFLFFHRFNKVAAEYNALCRERAQLHPNLHYVGHHQFGKVDADFVPMNRDNLACDGLRFSREGSAAVAGNILQAVQTVEYILSGEMSSPSVPTVPSYASVFCTNISKCNEVSFDLQDDFPSLDEIRAETNTSPHSKSPSKLRFVTKGKQTQPLQSKSKHTGSKHSHYRPSAVPLGSVTQRSHSKPTVDSNAASPGRTGVPTKAAYHFRNGVLTKASNSKPSSLSVPTIVDPRPSSTGSEPTTSGSKPTTSGSEPTTSGSKPSASGSKSNRSGSKPNHSGSKRNPSSETEQVSFFHLNRYTVLRTLSTSMHSKSTEHPRTGRPHPRQSRPSHPNRKTHVRNGKVNTSVLFSLGELGNSVKCTCL